jgi:PadR family transcriptional regulator, regulatory protein PadR
MTNASDRELLHGNGETLVLALLARGDSHGYQIRKELARRSRDYFQFRFGSLYPLLRRLERQGLVTAKWVNPGKARERRNYRITPKGRAALKECERDWHRFAQAMQLVLTRSS